MQPIEVLARYDSWRGSVVIGDLFTLTKKGREVRCQLSTHAFGWELRLLGLETDGFERTTVCRTEELVFATADDWKSKLNQKGWS